MQKLLNSNIALIAILILFSLLKFESLGLPYFWDEAWSYIPAIAAMARDIPCLLPNCIDPELYRGHPLFFYFLASGWMKFISGTPFSMHLFALLISILSVLSFYRLTLLFLTPRWALLGATILILQETFYVQSSFVLPEALLMLLTIEAIRAYYLKRKGWFLACTAMLCLTKETGVVISASFILYHILYTRSVNKESTWVYCSILPAIAFYGLQKMILGWYFYPLHVDLANLSFGTISSKFEIIVKHLFVEQGRKYMIIGTGLMIIIKGVIDHRGKHALYLLALFIALTCLLLFVNTASILITLGILFAYIWKVYPFSEKEKIGIRLSGILILLFLAFTVSNFLMIRYLLPIVPVLVMLYIIVLQKTIPERPQWFYGITGLLILHFVFSMIYTFKHKGWHDDATINYTNAIKVHQEAVEFCEQQEWFENHIYTHFLLQQNLTNLDLGYLKERPFTNATYGGEIKPDDEIVVFSCIELDEGKYDMVSKSAEYQLVKRFAEGKAWSEIYVLKSFSSSNSLFLPPQ